MMWANDLASDLLARPGQIRLVSLDADSVDALRMTLILQQSNDLTAEIRLMRGSLSATRADLMRELAAVLQFPYYFGFNWSAVDDCLGEMNWLWARYLVLLIADAGQLLLLENLEDLAIFFSLLDERLNPGPPSDEMFCMSLVLVDARERLEDLQLRAQRIGRELPPVERV